MKKRNLLFIPAIAIFGSSLGSAALYNVKYLQAPVTTMPTSSLQGVVGGVGETWNLMNGTANNIVDSANVGSTIDVSGLSGGQNEGLAGSVFFHNSNQFGKGNDQTILIAGLDFNGVYDIYIYALSHNQASWGNLNDTERASGDFTTTNATGNGASQPLENGITGTNNTSFVAGRNYVLFQSIVASPSGNISIVADAFDGVDGSPGGTGDTRLHINGLQIVSIPEPTSAALLGLGAFALILRRRK